MTEERFFSLGRYLKKTFGERVHKIRISVGGLSEGKGKGEGEREGASEMENIALCTGGPIDSPPVEAEPLTVTEQLSRSKERIRKRFKTGKFIAHLHTGAGSCVSLESLSKKVEDVINDNEVIGITFCAVPECMSDAFVKFLADTSEYIHTWLELGVMSLNDETLSRIGMKHTRGDVRGVIRELMGTQLRIAPHIVLGLPGESDDMMRDTMRETAALSIQGINIHHYYLLNGNPLLERYDRGELRLLEREHYVSLVCDFIETLPPDVVLHRIVGEADRERLVAPQWTLERKETLTLISAEMENRNSSQGKRLVEMQSEFGV